jgi:hypothetical protein
MLLQKINSRSFIGRTHGKIGLMIDHFNDKRYYISNGMENRYIFKEGY